MNVNCPWSSADSQLKHNFLRKFIKNEITISYSNFTFGSDAESRGLDKMRERFEPLLKMEEEEEEIRKLKDEAEKFLMMARLSLFQSLLLKKEKEEIETRMGNKLFRVQGIWLTYITTVQ